MNVVGIVLGILLSLGSAGSYIPQFYKIIKYQTVEGISEMSLVIMNIGLMCLTMNSIIFSWKYFFCSCLPNLLPFIQIAISWVMVLIYYIIFIVYKFHKNKKYEKRILAGLRYAFSYFLFAIFVIALALGEKMGGHNEKFFRVFGDVLGYSSAIANGLVYIPQIVKLYQMKSLGNLSFLMYGLQTPGNLIIIYFQAVLFKSPISTWITYVIVFIEQTIILGQMIYYHYYGREERELLEYN